MKPRRGPPATKRAYGMLSHARGSAGLLLLTNFKRTHPTYLIHPTIQPSIPTIHPLNHTSIHQSNHPPVHPPIHSSTHPNNPLSTHPSIQLHALHHSRSVPSKFRNI